MTRIKALYIARWLCQNTFLGHVCTAFFYDSPQNLKTRWFQLSINVREFPKCFGWKRCRYSENANKSGYESGDL